ncbi:N-acetylmuramidase family protein [Candidatus Thiothrix sp. Deng01]|uniref:N-acetylmuramidase family protein n=1 Tax=Candidatus Thiothrix phosphatis TaxID=3112415 RepID=A0ABU6CYB1_9GAMM|nr:N-acetylmuramidase family protein [Candidatus Thiothrix sp. Deng01]MEB4591398.1 N-acetylmuramidase family protein [Candidatus Thiothrix sp. Deng01]
MSFSREQYAAAAETLGCEPEMIEAVCEKEVSGKQAFFTQGGRRIPKILYERHKFWELLEERGLNPRQLLASTPDMADVLAPSPYKRYGRYIAQYERRNKAITVDREAAFGACSYASFQIMGYHFASCGYPSAEAFAEAMENTDNHLPAFVAFIKDQGFAKYLQQRDFEGFAKHYNGASYWKKGYHIELARIYQRILARNLPKHDSAVIAAVKSATVQRAGAAVAAAAAPAAPLALDMGSVNGLIQQLQGIADSGNGVINTVQALHQQAEAVSGQLGFVANWLPWLSGGWTLLLLVMFALVVRRYLHDRGYVA